MDENADAWELWLWVNTQWRAGGMGIVGLDYPAVYLVAGQLGIEMSTCLMGKIRALENAVLTKLAETTK